VKITRGTRAPTAIPRQEVASDCSRHKMAEATMTPCAGPGDVGISTTAGAESDEDTVYAALVVDSGPIIRFAGMSALWLRARRYYTVPAVLNEIRDAKARQHLEQLPFELETRIPSAAAVNTVAEFARLTGDLPSLSRTDLQILALQYDLECQYVSSNSHIRRKPRRIIGQGPIVDLAKSNQAAYSGEAKESDDVLAEVVEKTGPVAVNSIDDARHLSCNLASVAPSSQPAVTNSKPFSWATVVSPASSGKIVRPSVPAISNPTVDATGGIYSDAEEDGDDDGCDSASSEESTECDDSDLEPSGFPSLASTLPSAGNGLGGEKDPAEPTPSETLILNEKELEEERKKQALLPVSKSGKLYNSFRKYGDLLQPAVPRPESSKTSKGTDVPAGPSGTSISDAVYPVPQSRFIGGASFAGQSNEVEDDGEGWITTQREIVSMKAAGSLDPGKDPAKVLHDGSKASSSRRGPPVSQRVACATTDFAMQNVILQMNLELLSLDGIRIRKMKSWVLRCGACFKVHTSSSGTSGLKRLFCEHCGSDMVQRVAASIDSKTGRLKLHLKKNYQHNLRGTKFSLPKPGSGNRFQGDLLLREDQLLAGAWNQKLKILSGGKARTSASSMFGSDIASNMGCNAKFVDPNDLKVGFGKQNPNAVRGRERRGKKKKSTNKACGLHRY
jgi:RNA-binding protein NOB1